MVDKTKKLKGKGKKKIDEEETVVLSDGNGFSDKFNDRQYEPETFADRTHISDVIRENEVLKSKVRYTLQNKVVQQIVSLYFYIRLREGTLRPEFGPRIKTFEYENRNNLF